MIDFRSEKRFLVCLPLKLQVISQKISLDEFFLNVLDLSDHTNVTCPARNSLVDLLILVHDPRLFFEKLFIGLSFIDQISSIMKLFVVHKNVGLGEACF